MIKLYSTHEYGMYTCKLQGNKDDDVDLQDLVYRLQQSGFVTDFGSNMHISNPRLTEFIYKFNNPFTLNNFKKAYKKHRKNIMDEKEWRKNI